jgi:hypothetical protein
MWMLVLGTLVGSPASAGSKFANARKPDKQCRSAPAKQPRDYCTRSALSVRAVAAQLGVHFATHCDRRLEPTNIAGLVIKRQWMTARVLCTRAFSSPKSSRRFLMLSNARNGLFTASEGAEYLRRCRYTASLPACGTADRRSPGDDLFGKRPIRSAFDLSPSSTLGLRMPISGKAVHCPMTADDGFGKISEP